MPHPCVNVQSVQSFTLSCSSNNQFLFSFYVFFPYNLRNTRDDSKGFNLPIENVSQNSYFNKKLCDYATSVTENIQWCWSLLNKLTWWIKLSPHLIVRFEILFCPLFPVLNWKIVVALVTGYLRQLFQLVPHSTFKFLRWLVNLFVFRYIVCILTLQLFLLWSVN